LILNQKVFFIFEYDHILLNEISWLRLVQKKKTVIDITMFFGFAQTAKPFPRKELKDCNTKEGSLSADIKTAIMRTLVYHLIRPTPSRPSGFWVKTFTNRL
jgi:hypothetical protein